MQETLSLKICSLSLPLETFSPFQLCCYSVLKNCRPLHVFFSPNPVGFPLYYLFYYFKTTVSFFYCLCICSFGSNDIVMPITLIVFVLLVTICCPLALKLIFIYLLIQKAAVLRRPARTMEYVCLHPRTATSTAFVLVDSVENCAI